MGNVGLCFVSLRGKRRFGTMFFFSFSFHFFSSLSPPPQGAKGHNASGILSYLILPSPFTLLHSFLKVVGRSTTNALTPLTNTLPSFV